MERRSTGGINTITSTAEPPCGVSAANALLGYTTVRDDTLRAQHEAMGLSPHLYRHGASAHVLVSVLSQHGLSFTGFTKELGNSTRVLLNNGYHWTAMMRTQDTWELHDGGNIRRFNALEAARYIALFATHPRHWVLAFETAMSNCAPTEYNGPWICGKGRQIEGRRDPIKSRLGGDYHASFQRSSKDEEIQANLEKLAAAYRLTQEQLTSEQQIGASWSCLFNVELDGKKVDKEQYKSQVQQDSFDSSYNPIELNFGNFFRHTNLWSVMIRSRCFILQILWLIIACSGKRWGGWESQTAGESADTTTLIALPFTMMFAFYLAYVVQRYYREYFAVRAIEGRLNDLVITWTGVVQKAPECKVHVENFCRYMHAATLAGFLSIGQNFQADFALDLMAKIGLLTQDDACFLAGSAGRNAGRLMYSRALQVLQDIEANGWMTPNLHSRLVEVVYQHRRNMADVADTEDRPIPFGYYMLVNCASQMFMFVTTLTADRGFVRSGQLVLVITFLSLAQILANHMARPLGWGPTKIDVIAITLERWWEQLKYLGDLSTLPPLSLELPKIQCKSTLSAVSALMNEEDVEEDLPTDSACGELKCECFDDTVINTLALHKNLQEGKSPTQDTVKELNRKLSMGKVATNPRHNLNLSYGRPTCDTTLASLNKISDTINPIYECNLRESAVSHHSLLSSQGSPSGESPGTPRTPLGRKRERYELEHCSL